jgi:ascorbate-specific PTS system EIIC-type component UlaA
MKQILFTTALLAALVALAGCSDQKKASDTPTAGAMKCGAGKCGANMVSGSSELAKKQRSILTQMSADDPRMGCVMNAQTVEAVYDCVRDPETGKLTLEYNRSE